MPKVEGQGLASAADARRAKLLVHNVAFGRFVPDGKRPVEAVDGEGIVNVVGVEPFGDVVTGRQAIAKAQHIAVTLIRPNTGSAGVIDAKVDEEGIGFGQIKNQIIFTGAAAGGELGIHRREQRVNLQQLEGFF